MYTVDMAIKRATLLGLSIYTLKSFSLLGRRVFLVNSGSRDLKHCVTHTPSGFICDCKSYEKRSMCAHIGCVVTYLRTLSVQERTTILLPRDKALSKIAKKKVKKTTTIGESIEDRLPAILMRGGK